MDGELGWVLVAELQAEGEASWAPASIPSAVIWQESTSCIYLHICLCLWLVIYSLPFMGSGARAHLNSSQVRLTKKEGWDTQSRQLLMFIEGYAFSGSCCHFSRDTEERSREEGRGRERVEGEEREKLWS